jgi:carboxypeptidase C (cathepsin A)
MLILVFFFFFFPFCLCRSLTLRLANFSTYSGYVTVDTQSNRNLFWMFAEAKLVDPATAPVVLWLTGGP